MKSSRIVFSLALTVLIIGLTAAEYSSTIKTDNPEEFELGGENHSIVLNFVDGGADITVDGANSEYVRPLDRDSYGYGLYEKDRFTVNNITIEVNNADYDTDNSHGQLNFTAYEERDVKTITEGQENQFYLNNMTNVLALKYVDGGAAIKLNDEETSLGNELQRGDRFYYGSIGIEALDYGYRANKAFLEYRIFRNESDAPEEPENSLGDVEAQCEIGDATQGNIVEYNIDIPDYSNYRDLDVSTTVDKNGEEYVLAERELRDLREGSNSYSDELTLPTPVASGEHEASLKIVNNVGEGELVVSCGTIDNEEEDAISDVEIDYQSDGSSFEFSTNAESRYGIEEIEWDLTGNNQYEARGREVTKNFDSTGEKEISLKVTDQEGNTETAQKTISVEEEAASTSISIDSDTVSKGSSVKFEVTVAPEHQEPGYTVIIEDPEGNAVWRDKNDDSSSSYSVRTEDWSTGEYKIKIRPEKNILRSVIDIITGGESLATESFELRNPIEPWKEFCQEQNYNTESISSQIDCIREEITPRWFEGSAGSDTEVPNSLCNDLLSYRYSESENRCVES